MSVDRNSPHGKLLERLLKTGALEWRQEGGGRLTIWPEGDAIALCCALLCVADALHEIAGAIDRREEDQR